MRTYNLQPLKTSVLPQKQVKNQNLLTSGKRAAKCLTYSRPMFLTMLSNKYKDGNFCSTGTCIKYAEPAMKTILQSRILSQTWRNNWRERDSPWFRYRMKAQQHSHFCLLEAKTMSRILLHTIPQNRTKQNKKLGGGWRQRKGKKVRASKILLNQLLQYTSKFDYTVQTTQSSPKINPKTKTKGDAISVTVYSRKNPKTLILKRTSSDRNQWVPLKP